ncbi:MAG: hypothetical protein KAQ83_04865 [Nanoarchaeota archaeon]|nr:hypothetical protein [Nanoarchaeota archaeon]
MLLFDIDYLVHRTPSKTDDLVFDAIPFVLSYSDVKNLNMGEVRAKLKSVFSLREKRYKYSEEDYVQFADILVNQVKNRGVPTISQDNIFIPSVIYSKLKDQFNTDLGLHELFGAEDGLVKSIMQIMQNMQKDRVAFSARTAHMLDGTDYLDILEHRITQVYEGDMELELL